MGPRATPEGLDIPKKDMPSARFSAVSREPALATEAVRRPGPDEPMEGGQDIEDPAVGRLLDEGVGPEEGHHEEGGDAQHAPLPQAVPQGTREERAHGGAEGEGAP